MTAEILASGLTLHLLDLPVAHTLGACLQVSSGAANDPPAPWGTAHVTEHVRIAAAHGPFHLFGTTGNSTMTFSLTALPSDAVHAARTLAALLSAAPVPDATFAAEVEAARVEARAAESRPLLRLGAAVAEAVLPGSGMSAAVLGDHTALGRVTPTDVDSYSARYLRPHRSRLAIAGPGLPADEIRAVLSELENPSRTADAVPVPASIEVDASLNGVVGLALSADPWDAATHEPQVAMVESALSRAGLPPTGRGTIHAGTAAVRVLCWQNDPDPAAIRAAVDAPRSGPLAAHDVARRQQTAFAAHSPLGRAQSALAEATRPATPGPLCLDYWQLKINDKADFAVRVEPRPTSPGSAVRVSRVR